MYDIMEGRTWGKATQGRKRMHLLNDLMVTMWHSKEQLKTERVAETVKSCKSYTCFSADYLNE